jgi:hypothetical protein
MTRVFLSGPMTGVPLWNHPAFHAAAAEWRARGADVFNPADLFDGRTDLPRETYMREDIKALAGCDTLVQLPGWEASIGARAEHAAAVAMGLAVVAHVPGSHETILDEASRIVSGARRDTYGHPLDNHGATAEMVSAYLRRKYGLPVALDAEDVCWFNVLQKCSRAANVQTRDTLTDVAGYARNLEMIGEERARRAAGG